MRVSAQTQIRASVRAALLYTSIIYGNSTEGSDVQFFRLRLNAMSSTCRHSTKGRFEGGTFIESYLLWYSHMNFIRLMSRGRRTGTLYKMLQTLVAFKLFLCHIPGSQIRLFSPKRDMKLYRHGNYLKFSNGTSPLPNSRVSPYSRFVQYRTQLTFLFKSVNYFKFNTIKGLNAAIFLRQIKLS